MGPEFYDWEGKMSAYKREVEREEKERKQRLEKANNLEKGWEQNGQTDKRTKSRRSWKRRAKWKN